MNAFDWFLVGVFSVIAISLGIIITARMVRPHSRKTAYAQAQINKKQGATGGAQPAAAPVAVGASPVVTPPTRGERAWEWFKEYLWIILGTVVVGLLLWWGWTAFRSSELSQSPSLKTVWEGTKNYWHWIVLILAIPFFVLYAVQKPWAKALQWLLAVTALMLFVFFPVLVGIRGDETPSSQSSRGCPLFSSSKVNECMMTKEKAVVTADQLTSAGEFEFCAVVPEGSAFHIVQIRTNTLEMWSSDGEFPAQYKMVKHNDLANGKCPNRF